MANLSFSSPVERELHIDTVVNEGAIVQVLTEHSRIEEPLSISFDTTNVSPEGQDLAWRALISVWEKQFQYQFVRLSLVGENLNVDNFIQFFKLARRKNLDHKIFVNFVNVSFKDIEKIAKKSFIKNISFDCSEVFSAFLELTRITKHMKCPLNVLELRNISAEQLIYIVHIHKCKYGRLEATVKETSPRMWKRIQSKCSDLQRHNPKVSFSIKQCVPQDRAQRPQDAEVFELSGMRPAEEYDCYFSIQSNLDKARKKQIKKIEDQFTEYNVMTSSKVKFENCGNRGAIYQSKRFVCFITDEYLKEASDKTSVVWKDLSYALKRGSEFFTVVILDINYKENDKLWRGHDIVFELGLFKYLDFSSMKIDGGEDLGPDPNEIEQLKDKLGTPRLDST